MVTEQVNSSDRINAQSFLVLAEISHFIRFQEIKWWLKGTCWRKGKPSSVLKADDDEFQT